MPIRRLDLKSKLSVALEFIPLRCAPPIIITSNFDEIEEP